MARLFHLVPTDILQKGCKGPARTMAMELIYRHAGMHQREIGKMTGIDHGSGNVAQKRLHLPMVKDADLRKRFQRLETMVSQGLRV